MGVLARADEAALAGLLAGLDALPDYHLLRGPESGLVMVRGRAGGSGKPFNLGEMTVTRCTVRTNGILGHAYVSGRQPEHAKRAALVDALLQDEKRRAKIIERVIEPLELHERDRRQTRAQESEATRVDFFTMVRGEDE